MPIIVRQDDIITSVADALQFISYYHPVDFIQALHQAYLREENPAAKDAMAQILINSRMCAQGHRPICQDTGIVTVFVEMGMNVLVEGTMSLDDMINEGVRKAYMQPDNVLRASILADPDGARKIPAITHPLLFTTKWCPAIPSIFTLLPRAAVRKRKPNSPCSIPAIRWWIGCYR